MKRIGLGLAVIVVLGLAGASAWACPDGCCGRGGGYGERHGMGPRYERGHGPGFAPGPRHGFRHDFRHDDEGPRGELLFNEGTLETLEGKVIDVDVTRGGRRGPRGVHLLVKTDGDVLPVMLGPAWYMKEQGVKIKAGDRIIVKGSRVESRRGPALIAAEVRKNDRLMILRDEEGIPRWSRRYLGD